MMQETRMGNKSFKEAIPSIDFNKFKVFASHFPHETTGYGLGRNGVAILLGGRITKDPDIVITQLPGWSIEEMEGRYIEIHFEAIVFVCAYFPSASRGRNDRIPYKEKFQEHVLNHIFEIQKDKYVILGADLNVAQESIDIHPRIIGLISSGFRREERCWLRHLTTVLNDTWRIENLNTVGFTTWFNTNRSGNMGMRYDSILSSKNLNISKSNHLIKYQSNVSDHIPVTIKVSITTSILECIEDLQNNPIILSESDLVKLQAYDTKGFNNCYKRWVKKNNKKKYNNNGGEYEYLRRSETDGDTQYLRKESKNSTIPNYDFVPMSVDQSANFRAELEIEEEDVVIGITYQNKAYCKQTEIANIIDHLEGDTTIAYDQSLLQELHDEFLTTVDNNDYGMVSMLNSDVKRAKPKKVADKVKPVAIPLPGGSKPDAWDIFIPDNVPKRKESNTRLTETNLEAIFTKARSFPNFLRDSEIEYLKDQIRPFDDAFSFDLNQKGRLKEGIIQPIKIYTIPHTPWNIRERPIPPAHFKKLIEFLKEKLAAGIMEPGSGPYASPWFVVAKKDGGIRFIQDLQLLNKVTIRDSGAAPNMSDLTERAAGYYIYSSVDCHSFYDQFVLDNESRDLTAIRTPLGLMRMTGLPQGWTNSVPNAQRVSSMIFHENGVVEVFMDDVLIFTGKPADLTESDHPGVRKFVVEHMDAIRRVLQKCLKTGLTVHGVKNDLFVPQILCLGVILSEKGRAVNPIKVDAVQKFKIPKNLTEVRSFVGVCAVFRMWIQAFSVRAYYLFQLYRKDVKFVWGSMQQEAFEDLKQAMLTAPVRRPLDYSDLENRPPILGVDAWKIGEGGCLTQEDENKVRYVIAFLSGLFSAAERKYPQIKLEACALLRNLQRIYYYIDGVPKIIVEVDAWALKGMLNNPSVGDATLLRWLTRINTFPIELKTIKGKANLVPDHLSRMFSEPQPESENTEEMDSIEAIIDARLEFGVALLDISRIYIINYSMYEEDSDIIDILLFLDKGVFHENKKYDEKRLIQKRSLKYFIIDGYLMKREDDNYEFPRRVITNKKDKEQIMRVCHEGAEGGHYAWEATYNKMRIRYYWLNMESDVKDYVNTCIRCRFLSKKRYKEPLTFTKAPHTIFMVWYADLIHMPDGLGGLSYIWHIECNLSAWPEAEAFPSKRSEPLIRWTIDNVFHRFGVPVVLYVDGGEFDTKEVRAISAKFGIRLEISTPYNHKAIGAIERGHSPLVGAIAKMSRNNPYRWPENLSRALFAKRVTVTNRGYSPYQLVFGQTPLFSIDFILESFFIINWNNVKNTTDLLSARMRQIERKDQDLELAREKLTTARKKSVDKYNKDNINSFRKHPLKIGDKVLKWDNKNKEHFGQKLKDNFLGPFIIVGMKDRTYVLSELNGELCEKTESGDRLVYFPETREEVINTEDDIRSNKNGIFLDGFDQAVYDDKHNKKRQALEALEKRCDTELFSKYDSQTLNHKSDIHQAMISSSRCNMLDSYPKAEMSWGDILSCTGHLRTVAGPMIGPSDSNN